MVRYLTHVSEKDRQKIRDEVLGTTDKDFRGLAGFLDNIREKGVVKVLGSETAIRDVNQDRPEWLKVIKVL